MLYLARERHGEKDLSKNKLQKSKNVFTNYVKYDINIIQIILKERGCSFMSIRYNVIIQKEEDWYVAKCIDNSVASQGKTVEEALRNLKEAIELYYQNEKPIEPREILITTLEVTI